jgi:hypothetical protein
MSGTIALSPTIRWSAASWLFDWVLTSFAETVDDADLSAELTGVVGENLGWLGFDDLTDDQRTALLRILGSGLREKAERAFPSVMQGREDALRHLDELSRLASHTA